MEYNPPPPRKYIIDKEIIIHILLQADIHIKDFTTLQQIRPQVPSYIDDLDQNLDIDSYNKAVTDWEGFHSKNLPKNFSHTEMIKFIEESDISVDINSGYEELYKVTITHPDNKYNTNDWEKKIREIKHANGKCFYKKVLEPWDIENFTTNERILAWRIHNYTILVKNKMLTIVNAPRLGYRSF